MKKRWQTSTRAILYLTVLAAMAMATIKAQFDVRDARQLQWLAEVEMESLRRRLVKQNRENYRTSDRLQAMSNSSHFHRQRLENEVARLKALNMLLSD